MTGTAGTVDLRTKPTIEGERVILRPVTEDDVPGLLALLADPEGNRLTGTHAEFDEAHGPALVRDPRASRTTAWTWPSSSARAASTPARSSSTTLDAANRSCGFRIGLRRSSRTAGSAPRRPGSSSTTPSRRWACTGSSWRCTPSIPARGRHVYERAGFTVEGTKRDALLWDGEWVDAILMSILSTDPRSRDRSSR